MNKIFIVLLLLFSLVLPLNIAQARTVIMPPPAEMPPIAFDSDAFKIENITLTVDIDGPKATTVLRYNLVNQSGRTAEADFLLPIPRNSSISQMTTTIDGQELKGGIYEKDEAWKIYSDLVRRSIDPGLLEYSKQDLYRARIFPVPAKGKANLEIKAEFLLNKDDHKFYFSHPISALSDINKKIPVQDIIIKIKNNSGLSSIYSPLNGVDIKREKNGEAVLTYKANNEEALKVFDFYFTNETQEIGSLLFSHKPNNNEDGYFLFIAEPSILGLDKQKEISKNLVFILDKSSSMTGKYFEQATEAVIYILERLKEQDSFNLYAYNGELEVWQNEFKVMTEENRKEAISYVKNLRPNGLTNIEIALKTSLGDIEKAEKKLSSEKPNYVLFLTDGHPTAGELDEMAIAKLVKEANKNDSRIFSFGVGYNMNARLLDRLSKDSNGATVFVSPEENIEEKISSLFNKLSTPLLIKTELKSSLKVNRLIPSKTPDVFAGSQLVVVGRYPKGGNATITLNGMVGDKNETYAYELNFEDSATDNGVFIERLWAQKRIAELIDDIDLLGKEDELINELVDLSTKYGILTPYTSFLALEEGSITNKKELRVVTSENMEIMKDISGEAANKQREYKASAKIASPNVYSNAEKSIIMEDLAGQDLAVQKAKARNIQTKLPKQINSKTFYYKNSVWQDSSLTDKDLDKPIEIIVLSDEYFELIKDLSADEIAWFAQNENALIKYNNKVYSLKIAKIKAEEPKVKK